MIWNGYNGKRRRSNGSSNSGEQGFDWIRILEEDIVGRYYSPKVPRYYTGEWADCFSQTDVSGAGSSSSSKAIMLFGPLDRWLSEPVTHAPPERAEASGVDLVTERVLRY